MKIHLDLLGTLIILAIFVLFLSFVAKVHIPQNIVEIAFWFLVFVGIFILLAIAAVLIFVVVTVYIFDG